MVSKIVNLDVFCQKKPYFLTILAEDCIIANKTKIKFNNKNFCFCTRKDKITVIAQYDNLSLYKTIYINENYQRNICIKLLFKTSVLQKAKNRINVIDKTYGFPVSYAILKFQK